MPTDRNFKRNLRLYVDHSPDRLRTVLKHGIEEWLKWQSPRALISAIARQDPAVGVDILHSLYAREEGHAEIGIDEVTGHRCLITRFPGVGTRRTVFVGEDPEAPVG